MQFILLNETILMAFRSKTGPFAVVLDGDEIVFGRVFEAVLHYTAHHARLGAKLHIKDDFGEIIFEKLPE